MAIPFTQYVRPHGRQRPVSIEMPAYVEEIAFNFIEGGGWYEAEVLPDGQISLTACAVVNDEPDDVECIITANGPGMRDAVERLVRASIKHAGEAA